MADDPQSGFGEASMNLPPLPGTVGVVGKRLAGGGHEEVLFSNDGRIVMATASAGMSRAYDVQSGELLLDNSAYQTIDKITVNPRRAKWEAIRFAFSALFGFIGLGGGLNPKLTERGKKLAAGLAGPTGLADFDIAARQVRKIDDEWLTLSPDGRIWASIDGDAPLAFYDARTGMKISTSGEATTAGDTGPRVFSNDGGLFVAESKRGVAGVWDVQSGQLTQRLKGHSADIQALAISADGRMLASAGGDAAIVLWDLQTGECQARQVGWDGGCTSMSFLSRRGRLLLAITDTATIGIFAVPTLVPATRIGRGEEGLGIAALRASPDGTLLAVGRLDDSVHLLSISELLANPERIEGDTVHVVASGPPTEVDDRRAAAAFKMLAQSRLNELSEKLEQEMRSIIERLPERTARVIFDFDPLLLVDGDSVSWKAVSEHGGQPVGRALELFAKPLLPAEVLADPQYQSAMAEPQETLAELFVAWMARHWQAVAPRHLKAVLVPPESPDNEYDLWKGKWAYEDT